ncbi:Na+/H+ antiporter subunit E [candidate division WOR-3 bacterium]|uniref:Na+/H+ antiporter subunit E n=1 Tax=candidate division WOR-3 bacterium TaxID=2052148 RepID=A0A9D5K8U1_UNCW3|nr:Na+/H+ antiporter subunit E [candidate division WOR-3 bacterium]MBD3364239.1 Na+/H+ antiporter subunit E [candidate division WOR-3 bacterium]
MRRIALFVFAYGLWLLLALPVNHWSVYAIGGVIAILAAIFFGGEFTHRPSSFLNPRRWFWAVIYIPVFLWHMLIANLDVAFRVLHPLCPVNPGIVKVQTHLKTDVAKAFLANSITLTPGTMTVDIDEDILYVHWIDVIKNGEDIEANTKAIVAKFEKYLRRIFE